MRSTLSFLLWIISVLLGVFLLIVNLEPGFASQVAALADTNKGKIVTAGAAAFFLVNPLVAMLRWFQAIRRNREISYNTDGGRISVSLIAIEEALNRAIEGEPEVKKAHVRVFEDRVKRTVVIEAVVTLWEVPNVTDRNRFCQRLLRRRFAELMPEQSQVHVNLHLHRLTERRVEAKPLRLKPTEAPVEIPPATGQPVEIPVRDSSGFNPVVGALPREPEEEDGLYVGPTYPVDTDDDDEPKTAKRR